MSEIHNNEENLHQNENDEIFDKPKNYKFLEKLIHYIYENDNRDQDIYNKFEKFLNIFLYNKDDYFLIYKEIYKNLIANNEPNIQIKTIKLLDLFLSNLNNKAFYQLMEKDKLNFTFFYNYLKNRNYIIHFRLIIEKDFNDKIISIKEENENIEEFFIEKKEKNIQNKKYYINKEHNKYINIYFKYYSCDINENKIHIIINEHELIKTIKQNERIKIEINLVESFKLSKILLITAENNFSESSILSEIYNNIINKSNVEFFDFKNNELYEHILMFNYNELKFNKNINRNYFHIGGTKSLIPILEIVYKEKELFEQITNLIFKIISNSYIDFLDAIYSHVFHCYYFFFKNNQNLNNQNNFKFNLFELIYNILIYEDMILELINMNNFYYEKQFFMINNDNIVCDIYSFLFDLISYYEKYPETKDIINFLLLYFNEKRLFPLYKNINKGKNKLNLIDMTFDELKNILLINFKFKANERNKKDIHSGLIKWLCSNSQNELNFFISNFHRYDIIYITFELCRKIIINESNTNTIEIEIIIYFLLSLKLGIIVEKNKEESIFYHNSNFLIILLNYLQNLKNKEKYEKKESININFILEIIIKVVDHINNPGFFNKIFSSTDSFLLNKDLVYFNFYSRFSNKESSTFDINGNNNNKCIIGNDINYDKIKNLNAIKQKINEFKYLSKNSIKQLIQYDNYLNYKLFRDLKKELFSWNSTYSNINHFFKKKNIKFKRCFHLTRDMAIPLLEPILDYNYYKTNFTQNFQIMEIDYDYKLFFNQRYKLGNVDLNNNINYNIYNCKINKIYYQIFGVLIFKDYYFEFIGNGKIINNLSQEEKLGMLGQFNEETKDSLYYIKILLHKINFILKRKYYFIDKAFEIYYDNNKSYYFIFENEEKRNEIFNKIKIEINDKKEKENFTEKVNKNYEIDLSNISNIIKLWKKSKISNFQYLMWINILGSRSYRDLGQYPVFPWLLNNYTVNKNFLNIKMNIRENEETIINDLFNNYLRDLDLPLGILVMSSKGNLRNKSYLSNYTDNIDQYYSNLIKYEIIEKEKEYKIIKEINEQEYNSNDLLKYLNEPKIIKIKYKDIKYISDKLKIENLYNNNEISFEKIPSIFGSHFSNPAYVCHYLTRIFPFSFAAVEIQGTTFDAPGRLFINLDKSFTNCINEKNDLREIIPEFYFLPEMFDNFNQLNLGNLQEKNDNENATSKILQKIHNYKNNEIKVNEVLTGFWNENNPIYFVYLYRKIFEKKELNINKWINLIFGIYSYGDNARKKRNLYSPYVYDNVIKCRFDKIKNDEKYGYLKFYELGVNPKPILIKFKQLDEIQRQFKKEYYYKCNIKRINPNNNENKKIYLKIPKKKIFKFDNNNNQFYIINFESNQINKKVFKIDDMKICDMQFTSIDIYNYKKDIFFLICGTDDGTTLIYNCKINYKKGLYKIFNNHSTKINYINANNNLNMFIDCSEDGYINLYTLPKAKLIRSIRKIGIEYVFLTSSPLIGFVAISYNKIYMYTINGLEVTYIDKLINIKEPFIIHDEEFNDYLVYNLEEIIQLPLLQIYSIEEGIIKNPKITNELLSKSLIFN